MPDRLPSSPRSLLPGNRPGEVIELPRVCAMFDKPYLARYKRGSDGALFLLDVLPVEAGKGAGKGSAAPVTLPIDAIDDTQERCPWCGAKSWLVHCDKCRSWICSAGRKGDTGFRCRASCGRTGQLVAYVESWQGREGDGAPVPGKPALPSGTTRRLLKS